jgi:hypothetical protein
METKPNDEFKVALEKARKELAEIEEQEKKIALRKTQLMYSVAALSLLCGEAPDIRAMKLAHAIRTMYVDAFRINPHRGLKPKDIRDQLRLVGYPLTEFKNELASIHTVIRRMVEAGEVQPFGDADVGGYIWVPKVSASAFYGDPSGEETKSK